MLLFCIVLNFSEKKKGCVFVNTAGRVKCSCLPKSMTKLFTHRRDTDTSQDKGERRERLWKKIKAERKKEKRRRESTGEDESGKQLEREKEKKRRERYGRRGELKAVFPGNTKCSLQRGCFSLRCACCYLKYCQYHLSCLPFACRFHFILTHTHTHTPHTVSSIFRLSLTRTRTHPHTHTRTCTRTHVRRHVHACTHTPLQVVYFIAIFVPECLALRQWGQEYRHDHKVISLLHYNRQSLIWQLHAR